MARSLRTVDLEKLSRDLKRACEFIEDRLSEMPARSDNARLAIPCIMGTDVLEYVEDDDGTRWPFVKEDDVAYWRGPLRKIEGRIEEARFFPEKEEIVWGFPWEEGSDAPQAPGVRWEPFDGDTVPLNVLILVKWHDLGEHDVGMVHQDEFDQRCFKSQVTGEGTTLGGLRGTHYCVL